ncbi:MAG: hypothetical protein FWC19_03305 [Treponema sp.]|nr:hypothetical protein [Treponema sp.]MCL2271817.1 hypothetical protein [Treponema sp.]
MKKTRKFLGIIAVTVIAGLAISSCNESVDDSRETTEPKTLVITGITPQMLANSSEGFLLAAYETGASRNEVVENLMVYLNESGKFNAKLIAGAGDSASALIPNPDNGGQPPFTLTIALYSPPLLSYRWSGSGKYDLWFASSNGTNYYLYRMAGVSIRTNLTTVAAKTSPDETGNLTPSL